MEKTILLQDQCFVEDSVAQGRFCNTSRLEGQYFIYLHVRVLNWTHSTGNRQDRTKTWILKFQGWNLSFGKHLDDSSRKITKLQGTKCTLPFSPPISDSQEEVFLGFQQRKHEQKGNLLLLRIIPSSLKHSFSWPHYPFIPSLLLAIIGL